MKRLRVMSSLDFYPRPPRGGRPTSISVAFAFFRFLSTPSARRATREPNRKGVSTIFLSTPSARRATRPASHSSSVRSDFYPRPPRGGRHHTTATCSRKALFLSTPSARRATDQQAGHSRRQMISIHALREEGDLPSPGPSGGLPDFYPRPPRGGRPFSAGLRRRT